MGILDLVTNLIIQTKTKMTAINTATDIPNGINSVERLVTWGLLVLARNNQTLRIQEQPNVAPELAIQVGTFQANDNTFRLFGRVSFAVDPNYAADGTNRFWNHIEELSNVAIQDGFKTN